MTGIHKPHLPQLQVPHITDIYMGSNIPSYTSEFYNSASTSTSMRLTGVYIFLQNHAYIPHHVQGEESNRN